LQPAQRRFFRLSVVKQPLESADWGVSEAFGAFTMETNFERRKEKRLRYHWPIWFAEDFDEMLFQGQMVDVSSAGAAFSCRADENCPYPGQRLTARFSVPRFGPDESFDMASFTRAGSVCRVDYVNDFVRRVAVQFAEPLSFKPGEQAESDADSRARLRAVTI